MTGQPIHGWIFFWGEARTCVGYDVSRSYARLHSDGMQFLPIDFYVTFDDFHTVGKCRLAWRRQDNVGVTFEGWVDEPFDQLHGHLTGRSSDFRNMVQTLKGGGMLRDGNHVH